MISKFFYNLERFVRAPLEAPVRFSDLHVFMASFPKSGNSWARFVVSNVNSILQDGKPINFHTINEYSPVVRGNRALRNAQPVEGAPLFLKTHFPYTRFFQSNRAVVIVRNPSFAVNSYYEYLKEAQEKKNIPALEEFIFHWRYGLNAWAYFMDSWTNSKNTVIFVRYEDLKESPIEGFYNIYEKLGYNIPIEVLKEAVHRSNKKTMRKTLETDGDPFNKNNFKFVKENGENSGLSDYRDLIMKSSRISKDFYVQCERFGYQI